MPRPVVPIFFSPRAASRARSRRPCDGRISAALSASFRFAGEMSSPLPRIVSISASSAHGSTTTPLPMIDSLPRTTPEGSKLNLYSTFPTTSVCPALWPPWKRTTTSARSDSQSTILPLPSSPHCAPTTATLPMLSLPPRSGLRRCYGNRLAAGQYVVAAKPARLGRPIRARSQCGDRSPALVAQRRGARPLDPERDQHPPARRRFRQGAQDRVGVKGEAGRRLRRSVRAGLVAPAAAQLAERPVLGIDPREKREADAGVILEAAVLHRIDGDLKLRHRAREPVEHRAEPVALGTRLIGKFQCIKRGAGRLCRSG